MAERDSEREVPGTAEREEQSFFFSVVMPVYMVEDYVGEAIESLIAQTVGFEENVQLILVDDGSPDRSGEICDWYAEKFPRNIRVIHKENGGVSSARNMGLAYATGKYINFLDSDDYFTPETLASVRDFFRVHGEGCDVACVPVHMFGNRTGQHILNDKFRRGTRVIDLCREPKCTLMMVTSSFMLREATENIRFNEDLKFAEDADFVQRVLLRKMKCGAVANGKYMYRQRDDSALTSSVHRREWYINQLEGFELGIARYAQDLYGFVPAFTQNTLLYDLRWKIRQEEIPYGVLTPEEEEYFHTLLHQVLGYIDDDIIAKDTSLSSEYKFHLLALKHGKAPAKLSSPTSIRLMYGNAASFNIALNTWQLNFLKITEKTVEISTRLVVFQLFPEIQDAYIRWDGGEIHAGSIRYMENKKCLGVPVSRFAVCDFSIPRDILRNGVRFTFWSVIDGCHIRSANLRPWRFFPLEERYANSYYAADGLMLTMSRGFLNIAPASRYAVARRERKFRRELWRSNQLGERKAVLARMLAGFLRHFKRRPLWLLSDRVSKAGDNGEALFRYLNDSGFRQARVVYAIRHGKDYDQLRSVGQVVVHGSFRYKLLFLLADFIISSHADEFVTNPFTYYSRPYKDYIAVKKFIFLQHGVTKDDMSGWLNRYNKNICGFICAAGDEYRSIVEGENYHYTPEQVWLTGFARFDRLYRDERRNITIMPTWRRNLMGGMDSQTGLWRAKDTFRESDYFRFYDALINDPRLLAAAREYGYTVCFLPHPTTIGSIDLFHRAEGIRFYSATDEYRKVYAESDLVVTDYSSAVFDFAYLRKPVVYTQFDKEQFFAGEHIYSKGYFDYETHGFGEVCYDLDSTVTLLIDYMKNGCRLKDKYRERIDRFFAYNDKENCRRITERILQVRDGISPAQTERTNGC